MSRILVGRSIQETMPSRRNNMDIGIKTENVTFEEKAAI